MFNPKILTAMKQKLKKIGVVAVLMSVFSTSVEASRWKHQATIQGPGGCTEEHYVCVQGFGFAFCEIGSTMVVITCPPGGSR
jgi:hypothetical protein